MDRRLHRVSCARVGDWKFNCCKHWAYPHVAHCFRFAKLHSSRRREGTGKADVLAKSGNYGIVISPIFDGHSKYGRRWCPGFHKQWGLIVQSRRSINVTTLKYSELLREHKRSVILHLEGIYKISELPRQWKGNCFE
jgi:hypothetical protein